MDRKGFTFLVKLYVYNRKYGMEYCNQITIDRIRGRLDYMVRSVGLEPTTN